ncbi:MAG: hypothetical protein A3K83_07635 [Omnitrophica WOR_2 bacterium RBG_13_44_8b]|nr:MAG: hypothetical protein A3K83_07635 [Omnitrophica WOR_2 bacterium RBG_13_44_8b]
MKDLLNKIKGIKNFNDFKNLELDQKAIIVIIALSLIIIYLDYTFFIKGQIKAISVVSPKVAKIKKDLKDINKNLSAMEGLKNKQTAAERKKVKEIISQEQVALLLQEISSIANNDGVKILQIKPSREGQKTEKIAEQTLSSLLVTLDLACSYHNLGKFINDLEDASMFMQVQNIKITEKEADSPIQSVNLVLKTYVKK